MKSTKERIEELMELFKDLDENYVKLRETSNMIHDPPGGLQDTSRELFSLFQNEGYEINPSVKCFATEKNKIFEGEVIVWYSVLLEVDTGEYIEYYEREFGDQGEGTYYDEYSGIERTQDEYFAAGYLVDFIECNGLKGGASQSKVYHVLRWGWRQSGGRSDKLETQYVKNACEKLRERREVDKRWLRDKYDRLYARCDTFREKRKVLLEEVLETTDLPYEMYEKFFKDIHIDRYIRPGMEEDFQEFEEQFQLKALENEDEARKFYDCRFTCSNKNQFEEKLYNYSEGLRKWVREQNVIDRFYTFPSD